MLFESLPNLRNIQRQLMSKGSFKEEPSLCV